MIWITYRAYYNLQLGLQFEHASIVLSDAAVGLPPVLPHYSCAWHINSFTKLYFFKV